MGSSADLCLGLIGPGLIGTTLLNQIHAQANHLLSSSSIRLHVFGICNSSRMLLSSSPINLDAWKSEFDSKSVPVDLIHFADHLVLCTKCSSSTTTTTAATTTTATTAATNAATNSPPTGTTGTAGATAAAVIADCTASDVPPQQYTAWLRAGIHIVTPNKKFGAGPLPRYLQLQQLQRSTGRHFFYEATVGAGLPLISTLRTLLDTGDSVQRVEGVLSGTLSFIFNTLRPGGSPFSQVVAGARAAGYTEPDPREDLSGQDVARKVVILARTCGMEVEMEQLQVESLVPPALQGLASAEEFMEQLPKYDAEMEKLLSEASEQGEVVRYVGAVDTASKTTSVALRRYPQDHPFAQLSGSDNMVVFTTARYSTNPLIVRGPGAGAEVTAAGVFGDLVQLAWRTRPA